MDIICIGIYIYILYVYIYIMCIYIHRHSGPDGPEVDGMCNVFEDIRI